MKLRYKIASAFFLLVGIALLALVLSLSYESPCQAAPTLPAGAARP